MQKPVRILNPVTDHRFTTKNRAARFVRDGRAEWVRMDVSIRFVSSDRRHRATKKAVDKARVGYDLAAHDGMATFQQLLALPTQAPARFLGAGKRKGAARHTFLATQGLRLPINRL
jgi:hypothetical protein